MYGIGIFCIVLSGFINLFDRKGKKNGATRAKAFDTMIGLAAVLAKTFGILINLIYFKVYTKRDPGCQLRDYICAGLYLIRVTP